jgi:hypothetical protein
LPPLAKTFGVGNCQTDAPRKAKRLRLDGLQPHNPSEDVEADNPTKAAAAAKQDAGAEGRSLSFDDHPQTPARALNLYRDKMTQFKVDLASVMSLNTGGPLSADCAPGRKRPQPHPPAEAVFLCCASLAKLEQPVDSPYGQNYI